jgi:hypothetical protein
LICGSIFGRAVLSTTSRRLLHPPDVGSEGKEVVDLEQEPKQAVGLVIQPDQFPDRLFAPAKRDDLLPTAPIRSTTRKCAARSLPRGR